MLHYCEKCGRIVLFLFENDEKKCDCCGSNVKKVPQEFLCSKYAIDEKLKEQFINEFVKTSPEFDQYLFDHREEILTKKNLEFSAKMAKGKAILKEKNRVPKCPICGSTNLSKITLTKRAVKTGLFGFLGAVDDAGKTWQCNECKSKF